MTEPTPAIEAAGLRRRFHDGVNEIVVLSNLTLEVERGESVAVIGSSGVGKSTLLHLLGALDRPDEGTVKVAGRDIFALSSTELAAFRNASIGFVFQFHYLLGDFDAEENVMMPLVMGGVSHSEARAKARRTLDRVGLSARTTHRPGELSGGEQQRVAVARAIVADPSVVLADEPTGNLDPHTANEVHELLREVQHEAGCSMLIATHNSALAESVDRTLRLTASGLEEVAA